MPRDRLEELRGAAKHAPITEEEEMKILNESVKASTADKDKNTLDSLSIDAFLAKMADIVYQVDLVEKNTRELRSIQTKILMAPHRDEALEQRVEELMADNQTLSMAIRKTIDEEQLELGGNSKTARHVETRLRKTQIAAHSKRFYNVWNEYNMGQVEYRDKSKKLLMKRCKITNSHVTDEQIEKMLDEGDTWVFAKGLDQESFLARRQLTGLRNDHDEFLRLERSIHDVHDMLLDISSLVAQQGDMIDNIEANVNAARTDMEMGTTGTFEAERKITFQRKATFCCTSFCVLIVVFVGAVVALAIISKVRAIFGLS